MGYAEDQLAKYKAQIEGRLKAMPGNIDAFTGQQRDMLAAQDLKSAAGVRDIATGAASTYGLNPNVVAAANEQRNVQNQQRLAKRNQTLSFNRMGMMQDFYNKQYTYALSKYQEAGYSLQKSQDFARQWANQKADQQFQAETAQSGRDFMTQKNTISNDYADLMNQPADLGNPYEQAFLRSILGLVPYAGYLGYKKMNSGGGGGQQTTQADTYQYGGTRNV